MDEAKVEPLVPGDLVTIEGVTGMLRADAVVGHNGIRATRLVCAECGQSQCAHVLWDGSLRRA